MKELLKHSLSLSSCGKLFVVVTFVIAVRQFLSLFLLVCDDNNSTIVIQFYSVIIIAVIIVTIIIFCNLFFISCCAPCFFQGPSAM